MAKRLTLQIDRPCFKDILNGVQSVEHRYIYPSNANRYVTQNETAEGLDVQPIQYEELLLINGRRKDAPRLVVKVKHADFIVFTDEDGKELTFKENGEEWLICQVWYYLGEVVSHENCPQDFFYDGDTKAKRLAALKQMEADMERQTSRED